VFGYSVVVLPGVEECFSVQVKRGEKVQGAFMTYYGGDRDIDFKILDPEGKTAFEVQKQESSSFLFASNYNGLLHLFTMLTHHRKV
jgi:hypothetical protein